jgi:hypothetical protein
MRANVPETRHYQKYIAQLLKKDRVSFAFSPL